MIAVDDFVPARIQHAGRRRKVRLVVMHATQSKERKGAARAVAAWFADPAAKGSAHVTCDDAETIGSVRPQDTAAGAPGANEDGFHIEQVGYSEQGEPEWLDAYSEKVLKRAATAARQACEYFDVPRVWLSVQDVRDGKAGITDHNTITKATGRGSHWDPGPHWPRGRFMALVNEGTLTVADIQIILDRLQAIELRIIQVEQQVPNNLADEIDELRRNLRKTAAAAGVAPGDIEG